MAIIGEEKKPHPFSKEGRALREANKPIVSNNIQNETKPATKDPMEAILQRLEKAENELKKVKEGRVAMSMKDARERYTGPYHYKFTLRGGIPVLGRTSKRMDPTKDLVFKNQFGQYESNHALVLQLANGETLEVEVNIFNRDKSKTEPMPCTVTTTPEGDTTYTFDTSDYGKITILSSNFIN